MQSISGKRRNTSAVRFSKYFQSRPLLTSRASGYLSKKSLLRSGSAPLIVIFRPRALKCASFPRSCAIAAWSTA